MLGPGNGGRGIAFRGANALTARMGRNANFHQQVAAHVGLMQVQAHLDEVAAANQHPRNLETIGANASADVQRIRAHGLNAVDLEGAKASGDVLRTGAQKDRDVAVARENFRGARSLVKTTADSFPEGHEGRVNPLPLGPLVTAAVGDLSSPVSPPSPPRPPSAPTASETKPKATRKPRTPRPPKPVDEPVDEPGTLF